METASNSDDVNERYRVVAPKNHPNPSHVYAVFVDERVDVDSSGGGQGAATSSAGLEDDAASMLSELTELSEPTAPRDGEDSEEESEEEVPLAEIHRLGEEKLIESVFASYTSPTYFTGIVGPTHHISDSGWSRRVLAEGARHQGRNVQRLREYWRCRNCDATVPSQVPFDLYIHQWSGGVQAWIFSADGWSELRAGDAHPVFSDRRFFVRRSEPPRWLKMNTYSRVERSAMPE